MSEDEKKVEVRFGAFACTIEGYDNPVERLREVMTLMQQVISETPALAHGGDGFDPQPIQQALDDDKGPGIVVIRSDASATADKAASTNATPETAQDAETEETEESPDIPEDAAAARGEAPEEAASDTDQESDPWPDQGDAEADAASAEGDAPAEEPALSASAVASTAAAAAAAGAAYFGTQETADAVGVETEASPSADEVTKVSEDHVGTTETAPEPTPEPQAAFEHQEDEPVEAAASEQQVEPVAAKQQAEPVAAEQQAEPVAAEQQVEPVAAEQQAEATPEPAPSVNIFASAADQPQPMGTEPTETTETAASLAEQATSADLQSETAPESAQTGDTPIEDAVELTAQPVDAEDEDGDMPETAEQAVPETPQPSLEPEPVAEQAAPLNIFGAPGSSPAPAAPPNIFAAPAAAVATATGAATAAAFSADADLATEEDLTAGVDLAPEADNNPSEALDADSLAEEAVEPAPLSSIFAPPPHADKVRDLGEPASEPQPQTAEASPAAPETPPTTNAETEPRPDASGPASDGSTRLSSVFSEPTEIDEAELYDPDLIADLEMELDDTPLALTAAMRAPEETQTPEPEPETPGSRFRQLLSRVHGATTMGAPGEESAAAQQSQSEADLVSETDPEAADGSDAAEAAPSLPQVSPQQIAQIVEAETVAEQLASAAAWLTLVEGQNRFTRREVMTVLETIPTDEPRELADRIKGFGKLVRSGVLVLIDDGVFAMAQGDRERFQVLIQRV